MRGLSQFCDRDVGRQHPQTARGIGRAGSPIITLLLVAGCSLAPVIAENTLDYNTAVETVTNGVLVTNILRARDYAPLYFQICRKSAERWGLVCKRKPPSPTGRCFPGRLEPRHKAGRLLSVASPASTSRP